MTGESGEGSADWVAGFDSAAGELGRCLRAGVGVGVDWLEGLVWPSARPEANRQTKLMRNTIKDSSTGYLKMIAVSKNRSTEQSWFARLAEPAGEAIML